MQTKADFVRSVDPDVSAKDVVAKAKEARIELTESYVYNVRGAAKAAAKRTVARPAAKAKAPVAHSTATNRARNHSVDDILKAAAAEIGLGSAIAILQGERDRVRAGIGG